jgi:hypothetical protein
MTLLLLLQPVAGPPTPTPGGAIVAGVAPAAHAAVWTAGYVNTLTNPSVEGDLSSIVPNGTGVTLTRVSTQAVDGSWSVQVAFVSASAFAAVVFQEPNSYQPGDVVSGSVYVKGAAGGEQVRIVVSERDSAGVMLREFSGPMVTLSSTEWTRLTYDGLALGASTERVYIKALTPSGGTFTFFADAAQVTETTGTQPFVIGAFQTPVSIQGVAPGASAAVTPGGVATGGIAPHTSAASVLGGGASTQGRGATAAVPLTRGDVTVGGRIPTESGALNIPTPGGAAIAGYGPTANIGSTTGGSTTGGVALVATVSATRGGATVAGYDPTAKILSASGGVATRGAAVVALTPAMLGGVVVEGREPTPPTFETPGRGWVTAGGRPTVATILVTAGGITVTAGVPAASAPSATGSLVAGGRAPTETLQVIGTVEAATTLTTLVEATTSVSGGVESGLVLTGVIDG